MKSHVIYFFLAITIGAGAVYFYKKKCSKCCMDSSSKNIEIKKISAQELKQEMQSNNNLVVLNVLAEEYYNDCKIPGSRNYDYAQLKENVSLLDKSKDYVVYCASKICPASHEAFKILHDMGFKVRAFEGGIKEWRDLGFATEGPCVKEYLK